MMSTIVIFYNITQAQIVCLRKTESELVSTELLGNYFGKKSKSIFFSG